MHGVPDAPDDQPAQPPGPGPDQGQDPGPDHRSARLERLARLRGGGSWSFRGAVDEFAAAKAAGFEPVGQVFGTTVAFLGSCGFSYPGLPGLGRCFVLPDGDGQRARTSADPYNPLLERLKAARELAIERAVAECRALGADGIIGMRISAADCFSHTVELTVEGTAVRARSAARPATPFTTHVTGQDLARLLRAGWMPCALVFGMGVAACHFDDTMFRQTRLGVGAAGNREVSGYTRIVTDARREARRTLEHAVRERGGAGAVIQDMTLGFSERECPRQFEQRSDYVAEATVLGSAVIPFDRGTRPVERVPLTIMRLDQKSGGDAVAETAPGPTQGLGARAFAYWSGREGP